MFALGGDASERVRSSAKFLSKASWRVNPRLQEPRGPCGLGASRRRIGTRASGSRWLVHELAFLKRQSLTLEFSFDCRIHRRFRNDETELPPDVSQ